MTLEEQQPYVLKWRVLRERLEKENEESSKSMRDLFERFLKPLKETEVSCKHIFGVVPSNFDQEKNRALADTCTTALLLFYHDACAKKTPKKNTLLKDLAEKWKNISDDMKDVRASNETLESVVYIYYYRNTA